uniref:Grh/CP2 DB domain-containing protein n=1 Tax=Anopheles farauti TaxID=69004 RepID=A0A182Q4P2_9DIPT
MTLLGVRTTGGDITTATTAGNPVAHGMCNPHPDGDNIKWGGAERKTRDEERRAAKRKMTATGRKKLDELYHPVVDRSEFYGMSDLIKPPVLFSPSEDIDKVSCR